MISPQYSYQQSHSRGIGISVACEGSQSGVKNAPIDFLRTCFPDLAAVELERALDDARGSLERAIDIASNLQALHDEALGASIDQNEKNEGPFGSSGKFILPLQNEMSIAANYADLCGLHPSVAPDVVKAVYESSNFNVAITSDTLRGLQDDHRSSMESISSSEQDADWYMSPTKTKGVKKTTKVSSVKTTFPKQLPIEITLPPRSKATIDADRAASLAANVSRRRKDQVKPFFLAFDLLPSP